VYGVRLPGKVVMPFRVSVPEQEQTGDLAFAALSPSTTRMIIGTIFS